METKKERVITAVSRIFTVGALWGIFEATVGYLLHLLPFTIGWLVWYPAACFFMYLAYQKSERTADILLVALLASGIKLLNLFMPIRIDRVINPAVSIILEAAAMFAVIKLRNKYLENKKKNIPILAFSVLLMNTLWRALYILYILLLVPEWMRNISVISSTEALINFLIEQNFYTCLIIFAGAVLFNPLMKPIKRIEKRAESRLLKLPVRVLLSIKLTAAIVLLIINISLQFAL